MATLTIRNLPDAVHARLKAQAERNRRSLNQEVIAELLDRTRAEPDEGDSRNRAEAMIERVVRLRSRITRFMTAEEIDKAMEKGRR